MYKVRKDYGVLENIFLVNTDTMAQLNLGKLTPIMSRILELAGYSVGDMYKGTSINIRDVWDIIIDKPFADELRKLAMPMKKPIRNQSKKEPEVKQEKKIVDVLDIIYGLN